MTVKLRHIEIAPDKIAKSENLDKRSSELSELSRSINELKSIKGLRELAESLLEIIANEEQRMEDVKASTALFSHQSPLAVKPPLRNALVTEITPRAVVGDIKLLSLSKRLAILSTVIAAIQTYRGEENYLMQLLIGNIIVFLLSFTRKPEFAILNEVEDVQAEMQAVLEPEMVRPITNIHEAWEIINKLEALLLKYRISEEQHMVEIMLREQKIIEDLARLQTKEGRDTLIASSEFQALKSELKSRLTTLRNNHKKVSDTIAEIQSKIETICANNSITMDHSDPTRLDFEEETTARVLTDQRLIDEINAAIRAIMKTEEEHGQSAPDRLTRLKTRTKIETPLSTGDEEESV